MSLSLKKARLNTKYDSRLVEMNLQMGRLTREEYQKYLDSLEDDAKAAQSLGQLIETQDSSLRKTTDVTH